MARRLAHHHRRARGSRRAGAHRLAPRPRRDRVTATPPGATAAQARAGYGGGGANHHPPVQRDERGRPPHARAGGQPRCSPTTPPWSSSPTASTSTATCGRCCCGRSSTGGWCWSAMRCRSLDGPATDDRRRDGRGDQRPTVHVGRAGQARGLGDRAGHRGAEPGRDRRPAAARGDRRHLVRRWSSWASPTAGGSRSVSARTSRSSTTGWR